MDLREVMGDPAAPGVEISSLAYDSRAVRPGALFFCVPGFTRDGHDLAPEALENGAVALAVERPLGLGAPEVVVASVRAAMGPAAARFHGDPSAQLTVVGVTGTNGKTTTAFLVRSLLEASGRRCGLLGTVKSVVGGVEHEVVRTTPEAIDLQGQLRAMVDAGDAACVMEISSHALELGRARAIRFDAAIFTNLTQDHLDFHSTMEDYFAAKRRLFCDDDGAPATAIVNLDDHYGRRLRDDRPDAVGFAIEHPEAAYRARDVEISFAGARFAAETPDGPLALRSPLPGRFNVLNVLGAVAAARAVGVEPATIERAVPEAGRVPGRFEPVEEGQGFAVIVDYAHTPDSLENVLNAARELAGRGRVLCVFGCGGDRDRDKRPKMGAIAARLADAVVVTSDNPRSEDPEAIIREVLEGAGADAEAIVDRREAIRHAIGLARAGDVLVIAGKGHEQGQELAGGRKVPFDDVAVAREALRGLATASA
jgi:UDP-N-acetylmuramoyl-L-alanyl-D-glutamate--2,6-diaminopimelate ligase